MIFYLVTEGHSYTINKYLTSWGYGLASRIRTVYYEELFQLNRLPLGAYIFSDIERLNPQQADLAAKIWQTFAISGSAVQLLNHPTRSMRRYELLRTLYERGQNQFNVYRLTELRQPKRFPVFIRGENDHRGSLTDLLHTSDELEAAITKLSDEGHSREDKLIVEYCDTSDEQAIFRKYSAFIVGDRILPRHLFFSDKWVLKSPKNVDEASMQEERTYVETNPHEAELREIFRLANIQYGRIDYSLLNGVIQVWEINTNPMSLGVIYPDDPIQGPRLPQTRSFAPKFDQAFEAIDSNPKSTRSIPISVQVRSTKFDTVWKWIERSLRRVTAPFPHHQQFAEKHLREIKKEKLPIIKQKFYWITKRLFA